MPAGNSIHWSEQAETMAKVWTETQKKMWENWFDLARAASAPSFFHSDIADQWRELATQGLETWTANTESTAKNTAERLLASQEAFMRFLEFSASAWKALIPKVESGEDWQSVLKSYLDQLYQQLLQSPASAQKITQDTTELWRLYLEELQKLTQPWLKSLQQAPSHLGQTAVGNGSALIELTHLYWDTYERTFGRLLESPSLGYTRELNEKILKGFDAWQDFRQASMEYQAVLAHTWVQVFEQLMRELVSLTKKGEAIQSLRDLILLWNNVADPVFIEVFRSEKYIRIQGRLLNTAMAYRIHQREIVELFLKIGDMPTRSEVDEAHRSIYEQRKEIKALKKALAEMSTSLKQQERVSQSEIDEARRSIDELRQEVKALRVALAETTAAAKAKSSTKRERPATKHKQAAASEVDAAASNPVEGGEHATVSGTDPA